jgi:hypothetical protein
MHRAAVLIVLSLAFVLAACGGDSSERPASSPSDTTDQPATREDGGKAAAPTPQPKAKQLKGGELTSADGSGKAHGDGSIERFGEDGSSDDFEQAVDASTRFHVAVTQRDWDAACDALSSRLLESMEKMTARSPEAEAKECPELLESLVGAPPTRDLRRIFSPDIEYTGMRVEDDSGFLLLKSPIVKLGYLPMARDDGEWKVASIAAAGF